MLTGFPTTFGCVCVLSQELSECKRALAAVEIDELGGGEEQNDLLDYLRALEPEQVKEGAGVGGWEDGGSGFGLG